MMFSNAYIWEQSYRYDHQVAIYLTTIRARVYLFCLFQVSLLILTKMNTMLGFVIKCDNWVG